MGQTSDVDPKCLPTLGKLSNGGSLAERLSVYRQKFNILSIASGAVKSALPSCRAEYEAIALILRLISAFNENDKVLPSVSSGLLNRSKRERVYFYFCKYKILKYMSSCTLEGGQSSSLFAPIRLANPCLIVTDVGDSTALLL